MKITIQPQEVCGNCSFSGAIMYTKAFGEVFKEQTTKVTLASMSLIFERVRKGIADYLQVFTVETDTGTIKFWVIDDGSYITFLLPSDY